MAILATAGRVSAVTMDQFDITGYYNEYKFKRDASLIDVTPFGQRVSITMCYPHEFRIVASHISLSMDQRAWPKCSRIGA